MKRRLKQFLITLLVISFVFWGCSRENPETKDKTQITVGAAASLENAMEEIQDIYMEKNPEKSVTFTYGSSGALMQQIEQGAPIDVFISAAAKQMDELESKELIMNETETIILENKVVLIVPASNELAITKFEDILKAPMIAIGDPDTVPAGQYAKEVLEYLNLYDEVLKKTTLGKDVTEVLTWVSTGNADAGVVYETDALSNDNVKIAAKAPEGSHSKVIYPGAVVKNTKEKENAREFLEFLQTEDALEVFEKYGFTPVK